MSVFDLPFNDPYHSIIYTHPTPTQPSNQPHPDGPSSSVPFPPTTSSLLPNSPTMSLSSSSLISSTPTPITRFLILSQPHARYARTAVEVLLWRRGGGGKNGGKGWSWAVVMGWWAVCLGGWEVVRFLLPPLLLFLYFLPSLPFPRIFHPSSSSSPSSSTRPLPPIPTSPAPPPRPKKKEAPTAQTLLTTVSDFSAIHSLLCQAWPEWLETPDRRLEAFGWKRVGRGLVGVWIVWVLGGVVLGLRVMLGLIGTVLLLLPSPYFRPLLNATQSSYLLRRITTFVSLVVLGPSPSSTSFFSMPRDASTNFFAWAWKQAKSDEEDASKKVNATTSNTRGRSSSIKEVLWAGLAAAVPKKLATTKEEQEEEEREEREQEWQEEPVQFRFEVMENQRWWLALDWTTTLAPSDRPVWCDTHLNSTPPPSQFTLPPASTILLPDPSSSTHQIQRTAVWHWLDPDWSIALHLPNSPGATSFVPSSSPRSPTSSSNNPLPPHKVHHHHTGTHHGHHTSISSQPLSPSSSSTATSKPMSLGEQALSKGLERLKAVSLQASSSSSLASLTGVVGGGSSSNFNANSNANANGGGAGGGLTSPSRSSSVDAGSSSGKTLFAMSQPEGGGASGAGGGGSGETMMMEVDDLDAGTDESGWSYGGNKWEGMGAKGGLGKFTRRRRWTRLALLTEHVQLVPLPPPVPSSPAGSIPSNPPSTGLPPRRSSSLSRSPTREKNAPLPALPSQVHATTTTTGEVAPAGAGGDVNGGVGGALRMRLKKAVEGHGEHT